MASKDTPQIEIKQQNRRSMAMRITPSGDVIVFIPYWVKPNSRHVRQFIDQGLKKIDPYLPTEKPEQHHDAKSIRRLVKKWAKQMGVNPGRVQLRTMYRKWGSCSTKGTITLNTALYYLPDRLVEYVVVHELTHLFIFDHSPAFWSKMGEYLPDYAALESELDNYRV